MKFPEPVRALAPLQLIIVNKKLQEYWLELQAERASNRKQLPAYVSKEFDEYLKCGRLERCFPRVRC